MKARRLIPLGIVALDVVGVHGVGVVDRRDALVHPDDAGRVRSLMNAHLRGETPYFAVEHRMRRPILSGLHGLWSVGLGLGAGAAALAAAARLDADDEDSAAGGPGFQRNGRAAWRGVPPS